MMNLNSNVSNYAGFTLIETLLAMALVALSLMPVINLQSSTARRVVESAEKLDRLFTAYDFFVVHMGGEEESVSKTNTDPDMKVRYERTTAAEESPLAKEFNHLYTEVTSWQWQGERGQMRDQVGFIRYMPPEKEEQKQGTEQEKAAAPEQKQPATSTAPAKPNGASKPPTPPAGAARGAKT
jgi:prepilin-type N-terminal cleavage/methylation domain-containing protein